MRGLSPNRFLKTLLFAPLILLPLGATASAQDVVALGTPTAKTSLTPTQILGQRLFYQHCSVCHDHTHVGPMEATALFAAIKTPGPALYGEFVKGSEEAVHDFVDNGSPGQMPGFKYALQPDQIDAIIAFLETVPKPETVKTSGDVSAVSGSPDGME